MVNPQKLQENIKAVNFLIFTLENGGRPSEVLEECRESCRKTTKKADKVTSEIEKELNGRSRKSSGQGTS